MSIGRGGDRNNPDVKAAEKKVFETALKMGIPPRAEIGSVDEAKRFLDMGVRHFNLNMDIYILFRDVRTYGLKEDFYREAAGKGVRFIRYEPEDPPQVEPGKADDGRKVLKVTATDYILGKKLELDADYIALAAAVVPSAATKEIASLFKVVLSPDGFFNLAFLIVGGNDNG